MALFGSSNDESISIIIRARDEASRIIKGVQQETQNFKNKLESMQPTFQKMAAIGGAATLAIGAGIGKAIKEASDLGESINAVNVVFGDGAKTILDFGQNSAKSVGMATSAFNQMATITGALLKDTGLSMTDVASKTNELTVRAADMASVFNTDVNDAMSAINQAIRGETEAIRRYAGDVTDASLQTYLLAEGINKNVTELTEQEKRLYRVDLIMKQTAVTQGDFANTSDSLANQQRILSAEFTNMAAKLGEELVPMAQELLKVLRPILEAVGKWISENPELAAKLVLVALGVTALITAVGILGLALPGIITAFQLLGTGAVFLSGTALPALVALLTGPVGVVLAMAAVAKIVYEVIQSWKALRKEQEQLNETARQGIEMQTKLAAAIDVATDPTRKAKLERLSKDLAAANREAERLANLGFFGSIKEGITDPRFFQSIGLGKLVNDAIISPNGNIITTHPDDYLIATKDPQGLVNRNGGSVVNIEFNYPQFSSQDDVARMKTQIDRALRDVMRNHKLTTI